MKFSATLLSVLTQAPQIYQAVALPAENSIDAWGGTTSHPIADPIPPSLDRTNIAEITCIYHACFALKKDGTAIGWGSWQGRGPVDTTSLDLTNIKQIHLSWCSGVAVKNDDTAISLGGVSNCGEDPSSVDLTNIEKISAGGEQYIVLKKDATVEAWGNGGRGGNIPSGYDVTNVADVMCGGMACGMLKKDGTAFVWGSNDRGGNAGTNDLTNVVKFTCGHAACMVLKLDKTVIAWGYYRAGGDITNDLPSNISVSDIKNVAEIFCGKQFCGVIKENGDAITWGYGGSNGSYIGGNGGSYYGTNVAELGTGDANGFAMKNDGTAEIFGQDLDPTAKGIDLTNVHKIVCDYGVCNALKKNGNVEVWGRNGYIESSNAIAKTGVGDVACTGSFCVYLYSNIAGGGGDPHFFGFGGVFFTWQGHCDSVLLKTPEDDGNENKIEIHARTKMVRKWSAIDAVAVKVGNHLFELQSNDGTLSLNGSTVKSMQNDLLVVSKTVSGTQEFLVRYEFLLNKDKHLQLKVNLRSKMIYVTLSGNYPPGTVGLLGSPYRPGLFARDGKDMSNSNINTYAENWQVCDNDQELFHNRRYPQYPSKCLYYTSKKGARRLREIHLTSMTEAMDSCEMHPRGPLRKFCIDDVIATGDIDSAKDEFYG